MQMKTTGRRYYKNDGIRSFMKLFISYILVVSLLVILALGCSRSYDPVDDSHVALTSGCVSCHTDKEMIIATATIDTTSSEGDTGEG